MQLVSGGRAGTTRCDHGIAFHTNAGLQAGSTKQEFAEALGVAMAMNAGAALHLPAASQQTAAWKAGRTGTKVTKFGRHSWRSAVPWGFLMGVDGCDRAEGVDEEP